MVRVLSLSGSRLAAAMRTFDAVVVACGAPSTAVVRLRDRLASRRLLAGASAALVAASVLAPHAAAATPDQYRWTNHDRVAEGYFDCGSFLVDGVWDITHHLTIFSSSSGVPTSDIEKVDFTGVFRNHTTGASVPDSGQIVYFDELDADGSIVSTMGNVVRRSAYVHGAGRRDYQTWQLRGLEGETDANVAALCAALS